MLLADVAAVSESVRATSSRREKATAIADLLLSTTARDPDPDLDSVTRYLLGTPRQRRLGVGPAALRELPPPADDPTLSVGDVDAFFQAMAEASGPGSAGLRRRLLRELMGRATTREQRLLVGLVGGDLRQGAAAGVMTEAAQVASSVPSAAIRRAVLVCGSLPEVVVAAMNGGEAAVDAIGMRMGIPMAPMLASSAPTVAQAMAAIDGPVAVEHKLDGIRVQAHRDGEDVRVFSRSGDDITKRLPEVVAAVRTIPVRSVVLDGEALVWGDDGRPASFQTTGSRVGRNDAPADLGSVPGSVRAVFFDLLHLDGIDRFGESSAVRRHLLEQVVPDALLVPRLETGDVDIAQRFYESAVAAGREGVVIKAPGAIYSAGRRGSAWIKVKPRHTLDLVVVAAEWGHGRRTGTLSNLHLAAIDGEGDIGSRGATVMLGKTFKGMTDEVLRWQTEQFLSIATDPTDSPVVALPPRIVAEVALDGVQRSSRYPGGVTLRFARLVRYRPDKSPEQADTLQTVRRMLPPEVSSD